MLKASNIMSLIKIFKNHIKITIQILFIFIASFTLINIIRAQYIEISPEDINLPQNESTAKIEYTTPKSLVLVPLSPPERDFRASNTEWYKGIYYYQTTRYNLPAISFHYVITEDGKLIENEYSVGDRKIDITNEQIENPILVAYMTPKGSIRFNPISKGKIQSILVDIVNENAISPENIYIKGIQFISTDNRQLKIVLKELFIGWQRELDQMRDFIVQNYNPIEKKINIEVKNINLPEEKQKVNTKVKGTITIKNTGQFPIYGGTDDQLLLTKVDSEDEDNTESAFFINDLWVSQTQINLMENDQVIMPDQETSIEFQLFVPLETEQISEMFYITNLKGEILSDELNLTIQIAEIDQEVIEILSPEAGYLKVRAAPSLSADEITRVSSGARYFVLEKESGWIKIQVEEDISGWVYGKYTEKLN
ncbi:SH3 domain-containing protein [Candidatus Dojkabacteria bacterium]|nr:SH3 domain-containing protein [Candidatus Dojkabacteria bacterium]